MLIAGNWIPHQQNLIKFVLADTNGLEVLGLGGVFNLEIAKTTGLYAAGLGTKGESGRGWYWYLATALEADTLGPVSVAAWGAGTTQQNMEYVCGQRTSAAIEFTYTVTDDVSALPIEGVEIIFSVDAPGNLGIWVGETDLFGVARDAFGNLPRLDPGPYFVQRRKPGVTFNNPDMEVVS